jgi:acetyl-CoA C-acetyltransferase
MDPRTPVLIGAAQISGRTGDSEPIDLMATVSEAALVDTGSAAIRARISSVRAVRGIWPYQDPGTLVAERLGLTGVSTAITQIGGNEAFDLVTASARSISDGGLEAVLI